ncbi:MAG: glycogen debranching enzyme N-terminal domain-containing protein [Deltaproteobacteria bacterium]|nr:glycogen debranching enzyme N-terminal domain-containing protein [Deltaproteobacteria bacterium]
MDVDDESSARAEAVTDGPTDSPGERRAGPSPSDCNESWLRAPDGTYCAFDVIAGPTRREHGVLVAEVPRLGPCVLVARLDVTLVDREREALLTPRAFVGSAQNADAQVVSVAIGRTAVLELVALGRRLRQTTWLERDSGTVVVEWTLLEGEPCSLAIRPFLAMRPASAGRAVTDLRDLLVEAIDDGSFEVRGGDLPPVRIVSSGAALASPDVWYRFLHRGDGTQEDLFMPGVVRVSLAPVEPSSGTAARARLGARAGTSLSRDEVAGFATPAPEWRSADLEEDESSALARGWAHLKSELLEHMGVRRARPVVVARFPDPGEHVATTAMVVPALLALGERERAETLLASATDELVPGVATPWCSADAGLWVIEGVRALRASGLERVTLLDRYYPACLRVIETFAAGTDAVRLDTDGLVSVQPGASSWLDSLVDGASATRAGKPVELSAAWHAALHTTADLATDARALVLAAELRALAKRVRAAFGSTFCDLERGHLADRVRPDGTLDTAMRPFQLLALSSVPSLVEPAVGIRALEAVSAALVTPHGIRTLATDEPAHDPSDPLRGAAWPGFLGALARAARRLETAREASDAGRDACTRLLRFASHRALGPCFSGASQDLATGRHAIGGSPRAWNAAELMAASSTLLDRSGWSAGVGGPTEHES